MSSSERDVLIDFANAVEAAAVNLKHSLGVDCTQKTQQTNAVQEITFTTLKFDPMKGEKLGDYEIAYKTNNIADKFESAYNVLRASNATIKDRYHGNGYQFSYWIYGEGKIYRQKLRAKQ
jgi:hypothetical protein